MSTTPLRWLRSGGLWELVLFLIFSQIAPSQIPPPSQGKSIDPLSVVSLLLKVMSSGQELGTATGFIVQKGAKYYLVTNWHVVTARRPDNNQPLDGQGRVPDSIQIFQNVKGKLGDWKWVSEDLFDPLTHRRRWIEHSLLGQRVDLVLLEIVNTEGVDFYPLNLELAKTPIALSPAGSVSIVGFPFGHASLLGLPIWKSGTIASDPAVDYQDSLQFLVDATGRPGMSGSPVYARRSGGFLDETGNFEMIPGVMNRFLGVYAGGIDDFSEIGRVWKVSALMQIYNSIN